MQHSDISAASNPILADLASCDRWLEREQITDSDRACRVFVELLDQLEGAPPASAVCAQILERLRLPMRLALDEQLRRYAGKSLPLAPAEAAALANSHDLWLAQTRAWRRLLRRGWSKRDAAPMRPRLALRTLECTAGLLTSHMAARHYIAPEYWHELHRGYEFAESENMAGVEIADEHGTHALTCTAVYVQVLLHQLSNPAALSQREFEWTRRWAGRWAHKARVGHSPGDGGGITVNLASDTGATWIAMVKPAAHMSGAMKSIEMVRFIDFAELRRTIRGRIKKLDAGETPEELALGRDCTPFAARGLLNTLLNCWNDAPRPRQYPRRKTAGKTDLVAGFADIHRIIAGAAFADDFSPWNYTRKQDEQVQLFRRPAVAMKETGPRVDRWDTLDESANGFRLRRKLEGMRLAHRQLVALRPEGANQFMLCDIRWLCQSGNRADHTGSLNLGAKALPGLPQACALRPLANERENQTSWTQAFALPTSKGLAPNLVVPLGWYQAGRELSLKINNEEFRIRLNEILERGHDYQRVSFAAIST